MGRSQGASCKWRNDSFATEERAFKQDDNDRHFFNKSMFESNYAVYIPMMLIFDLTIHQFDVKGC
jgi:hypothetical protein